jgi:hypothetical protein
MNSNSQAPAAVSDNAAERVREMADAVYRRNGV